MSIKNDFPSYPFSPGFYLLDIESFVLFNHRKENSRAKNHGEITPILLAYHTTHYRDSYIKKKNNKKKEIKKETVHLT